MLNSRNLLRVRNFTHQLHIVGHLDGHELVDKPQR